MKHSRNKLKSVFKSILKIMLTFKKKIVSNKKIVREKKSVLNIQAEVQMQQHGSALVLSCLP